MIVDKPQKLEGYNMKYKELEELAVRIGGDSINNTQLTLPVIFHNLAAKCFIEQIPENNDTIELRKQLKSLIKNGQFDL